MAANHRFQLIHTLWAAGVLAGCAHVYRPQIATYYDPVCAVTHRQMTLTAEQLSALGPGEICLGTAECASLFTGKVLMVPLSAIVSGSVVLVGNTLFWLEKQGRCQESQTALAAPVEPHPDTLK